MVKSSSDQNNPPTDYDVAIIGGGISGVYAAWRVAEVGLKSPHLQTLAQERQDGRLRIAVFETSDRIGGRLFSSSFSGDPGPPIELGGMRFLTSHVRVHGLVNTKLGLPTRKLAVNDPNGKNLSYLRGRHFTAADWGRLSFVPPYLLDRSERARSPGNLLIEVALRHLGGTLEALQAVGYHSEALESLRNIGFRNLMLKEMSAEAYELIRDACGYDTLVNNWGAAEAIPFLLADFDPRLEYFALNDGFQSLPKKLAKLFDDVGPTTSLHMRHRLFRIDQTQNGELQLTFQTDADPTGGSTG
ncbi:MAG TPA: FAD-dependent oxidoreductase, partial [Pirellulales bacterium]